MFSGDEGGAFALAFGALDRGKELGSFEIAEVVASLTNPAVTDAEKAAFLRAFRARGETPDEIAGLVQAFLDLAVDPEIDLARLPGPALDVCGTGGDRLGLFNVSTTACFVLAAGGAAVIKHGNRALTSRSGGSDVLAALGVAINPEPAAVRRHLETLGIGFLFAPRYHPAFTAGVGVRKLLAAEGKTTVFNVLGPLLNPARTPYQLLGVFEPALTGKLAEVLRRLGRRRAWTVHGAGGMDELSTLGPTQVSRCEDGRVEAGFIMPEEAGLPRATDLDALRGGTPQENAATLLGILRGEIIGPRRDLVLLNAAAGFVVAGLSADLGSGVERAREAIASGRARQVLEGMQDTAA